MILQLASVLAGSLLATHAPSGDALFVRAGHGQPAHRRHVQAPDTAFGRAGDPAKVSRVLELRAADMAFDRTQLRVRRGETIRLVLANEDQVAHEVTIGDEAAQLQHRRMMADGAHAAVAHAHANAVEAAPGARRELVWEFTRPGRFLFACNLPGHVEAGMIGAVVVD